MTDFRLLEGSLLATLLGRRGDPLQPLQQETPEQDPRHRLEDADRPGYGGPDTRVRDVAGFGDDGNGMDPRQTDSGDYDGGRWNERGDGRWNDGGDGRRFDPGARGDGTRFEPDPAMRTTENTRTPRPGEPPVARGADIPRPDAGPTPPALVRDLRELPPETLRQLGNLPGSDPARLHSAPPDVEAMAQLLARGLHGSHESRDGRQPSASEGRLQPGAADSSVRGEVGRIDGRLPAPLAQTLSTPGSERARTAADGAAPLPAQWTALQARPDAAIAPSPARADAHAGQTTAALPGAEPQPTTMRSPVDAPSLPSRTDGSVVAGDRGGPSGLPGNAAAIAAGVTVAAAFSPPGTTFAHAPQSAIQARKAQDARKDPRERTGNPDQQEAGGDPRHSRDRNRSARSAGRAPPDAEPATGPAAQRDPHAAATAAAAGHTAAARPIPARSADDRKDGAPAGSRANTDDPAPADPETRRSRRLQWLYWSLIAITYGCLAAALATVVPDLIRLPFTIDPDSVPFWRNALTGTGLVTGLFAWLLARRMR